LAALNTENLQDGLRSIDPYARYLPPAPSQVQKEVYQIRPMAIGVEIFEYESMLWIRPDHGGPSEKAGMPELGLLLAINKKETVNASLTEASTQIDRAIQKNWVALTVSNGPGGKAKTYVVRPERRKSPTITWQEKVGFLVIRVRDFVAHDTATTLLSIYETAVRPGSKTIIDLRSCSGGDLYESIAMAGMFIPEGLPLIQSYDRSGRTKTYKSSTGKKLPAPVGLLVDRRTASSAEIFAGILRYYGSGILIGEQTVGKCVSQTVVPLSDGGSLWLTNLGLRFPDNNSCTGKGLQPDMEYRDIAIYRLTEIVQAFRNPIQNHD